MRINPGELILYLKSLSGQYVLTQFKRKSFLVETASNGFFFTPQSTGKTRFHDLDTLRRIVEIYNNTGSLHPKDYFDITMNASYTLALIKRYIQQEATE
jgi:hypothetical protein